MSPVRAQSVWESRALDRSAVRAQDQASARQLTTAREIINAGREMFKETGGFRFTMKQVSVEAGVALQTVYRHFETKDLLVLAILEEEIHSSVAKIESAVGAMADPLKKVQAVVTGPASRRNSKRQTLMGAAIVREHLRLQVDYPADVALVTAPYFALIVGVLRNAADAGVLHIVDPERDARIIQHLVESFYHQFALGVSSDGEEISTAYLWDFCRAALDRGSH
ncbi:TetR/AcrR family transcriptional regulator [Rhodococcus sp. P1Y]|uniref:TetR/AcrR family transcriptional regulator n=1 Tax=Rhodococcus sp. P1Y TaxID=1302308 RepID=UPI001379F7C7|nr:TetR/AcrR family transcriptional regulator [Rhodococcus sp. P1Y]